MAEEPGAADSPIISASQILGDANILPPKDYKIMLDKIKRGLSDLCGFRHEFLNPTTDKDEFESPPYHYRWSDILLNAGNHFNIQAFRQSAKTSIVLRSFPLYCLMFPSKARRYFCIIKRNQDIAGDKLLEIEREYKSNPWFKQNHVRTVEESTSAFQVIVQAPDGSQIEVRIEAYGKGGSIRGALWGSLRPQILIIDDIQSVEDMTSERTLEYDWQWFLDDILFLSKSGRIFMISNNLGEKCISERIFTTSHHFNFICEKISRTSDLTIFGKPAWPARETQEDILVDYENYVSAHEESIWMRNCMCLCIGEQDRVFFSSMFNFYPPSHIRQLVRECNIFIRCDTAVKTKQRNDKTAYVVVAVSPDNHWFVLDVATGRWSTEQKINNVFELVRKWGPVLNVGFEETNESVQLVAEIKKEMIKRKSLFNIKLLQHGGKNKEWRIETALQPKFAAGQVWFPEDAPWLSELTSQLLGFSRQGATTAHDDLIDAFSYMVQDAPTPIKPEKFLTSGSGETRCDIQVI